MMINSPYYDKLCLFGVKNLFFFQQNKKPINYLNEIRKNRTRSEKLSFVESKNMSYDDKVKKVLHESEKIS